MVVNRCGHGHQMTTIDYHSLPNGNGVGVVVEGGPAVDDEHRKHTPGQARRAHRRPGKSRPAPCAGVSEKAGSSVKAGIWSVCTFNPRVDGSSPSRLILLAPLLRGFFCWERQARVGVWGCQRLRCTPKVHGRSQFTVHGRSGIDSGRKTARSKVPARLSGLFELTPTAEWRRQMAGLVVLIYYLVFIYSWLIVIRAALSWFPPRSGGTPSPFRRFLFQVTEPYLRFFRRFIPIIRIGSSGFDPSAIVALLVLLVFIQVLLRA